MGSERDQHVCRVHVSPSCESAPDRWWISPVIVCGVARWLLPEAAARAAANANGGAQSRLDRSSVPSLASNASKTRSALDQWQGECRGDGTAPRHRTAVYITHAARSHCCRPSDRQKSRCWMITRCCLMRSGARSCLTSFPKEDFRSLLAAAGSALRVFSASAAIECKRSDGQSREVHGRRGMPAP